MILFGLTSAKTILSHRPDVSICFHSVYCLLSHNLFIEVIENLIMCKGGISMQWQTRILSTSGNSSPALSKKYCILHYHEVDSLYIGLMIPEACATPTVVQKFEGAVKYLYSHSRVFYSFFSSLSQFLIRYAGLCYWKLYFLELASNHARTTVSYTQSFPASENIYSSDRSQ